MRNTIQELMEIALHAAVKAGVSILDVYYGSDFGLGFKSDHSPITIADKRAHKIISDCLSVTDIPVLSEEGKSIAFAERENWEIFWLVDPLDGTKEFVKRNDEFTVNIALIKGNSPIGGVVYVPVTRTVYWADGQESFKATVDDKKEVLSSIQRLPLTLTRKNFVIAGSRTHMSPETETYIQSVDTKGKTIEMRSQGSSLKICMVAEGQADIYPRLGPTMEWDTAAGHAVVKYAGKNIYQVENNEPLIYNKQNLLNPWFIVK
ncbi:MAG TPA: 3'(2'),5'-bisphosphate nucleotidase CysQ [Prolixibacteraceae bacterium]|nr:3'(2'),5'-bisphosphate nucleotidase CysQ [Prolixibacteraceae bacterium]